MDVPRDQTTEPVRETPLAKPMGANVFVPHTAEPSHADVICRWGAEMANVVAKGSKGQLIISPVCQRQLGSLGHMFELADRLADVIPVGLQTAKRE